MDSWNAFLDAPAFVLNLDRRPDRWDTTRDRLEKAGFTRIQRVSAVDAQNPKAIDEAYRDLGSPPRHPTFNTDFDDYPGTFGAFLSHVSLWKRIAASKVPLAIVFEDDIAFHTHWSKLAPLYYEQTPMDYDVLFLGSQLEFPSQHHIDSGPVFCLHAYALTPAGAQRLLNFVCSDTPGGIYTIDTMLKVAMENGTAPFHWYVWNALFFPCPIRDAMSMVYRVRNGGLVYQDESFGTDIRVYSTPTFPTPASVKLSKD